MVHHSALLQALVGKCTHTLRYVREQLVVSLQQVAAAVLHLQVLSMPGRTFCRSLKRF
jgi:hypothetical protein